MSSGSTAYSGEQIRQWDGGKKIAARADAHDSHAGKVVLERAADEEALRILCCWRRDETDAEVHH